MRSSPPSPSSHTSVTCNSERVLSKPAKHFKNRTGHFPPLPDSDSPQTHPTWEPQVTARGPCRAWQISPFKQRDSHHKILGISNKAARRQACSHLSHAVGHLQGQVLQDLPPDDVIADLLRCLARQNPAVELPGARLGLHQEVPLSAQNMSHSSATTHQPCSGRSL